LGAIDMENGAQNSFGTKRKAVFREACQKHLIFCEDLKLFNSYNNII
jgi:hypothetical protein